MALGLQSFTPARLCCQAEKMAEGLASPALLLSAHLGPCTGTCVPCARGPELLCLGPGLTCLSLPRATAGGATLRIESAVCVANDQALRSFRSTGGFDIDPLKAHKRGCDTLLFHGTKEIAVPNIQAIGRPTIQFAANGMLGKGI